MTVLHSIFSHHKGNFNNKIDTHDWLILLGSDLSWFVQIIRSNSIHQCLEKLFMLGIFSTNSIKRDSYHGRRMHWHKQEKGFCKPSKLSVQVQSENYFMLNSLVYTSRLQNFYGNYSAYKPKLRALWFSANGFPQNWTLFQLFRNESPCILCFQFCFTWNWIVPISLPKSFHYCWMHVRTAIGCCLSFTLMLGILRAF